MRIIIDLQGAQSSISRNRGIGRYALSLTKHIAYLAKDSHEVLIALNGAFIENLDEIKQAFKGILPSENFKIWFPPLGISFISQDSSLKKKSAKHIKDAFFSSLKPDLVLITSFFEGFADECITDLSGNYKTAVVVYDLIPLMNPDLYLENVQMRQWYLEKIDSLKKADLFLAISESSRQECLVELGMSEDRVVNISAAADSQFSSTHVNTTQMKNALRKHHINRDFILYTGGIDPRKNIEGLIEAYSLLEEEIRNTHQLTVVCSIQPNDRKRLKQLVSSLGLASSDVIFTGYVSDVDLIALYKACKVFVFPSKHEGFGLPALEAMHNGAPVIASNVSSLPEVVGYESALFDPNSAEEIALKITDVIKNNSFRQELIQHGLRQSKLFSWEKTAARSLDAIEKFNHNKPLDVFPKKARLAFVSPLPPEKTGIGDYSSELLKPLSEYYEIDVITSQVNISWGSLGVQFEHKTVEWFKINWSLYDRVVYHFGNSTFHDYMFELLEFCPGVVVLHDFYLSNIQSHRFYHQAANGELSFCESLYNSHGYKALLDDKLHGREWVINHYPLNLDVLNNAVGIITHSNYALELADSWYGDEVLSKKWNVIPHLRTNLDYEKNERIHKKNFYKKKLGFNETDFIVCSFGFIGKAKLNDVLLKAWLESSLSSSKKNKLVFVGSNGTDSYGQMLSSLIEDSPYSDQISITGWADSDMFKEYLWAADLAVQLRAGGKGETSGTVLDCMNYGVPLIVNANGTMAELEEDAVYRLNDDFTILELTNALNLLCADESTREILTTNAKNLINTLHQPLKCAGQYFNAIEKFYKDSNVLEYGKLLNKISLESKNASFNLSNMDLEKISNSIAKTLRRSKAQKQVFINVSALKTDEDFQKVHSLIMDNHSLKLRFIPVVFKDSSYCYAHEVVLEKLGLPSKSLQNNSIDINDGDIFVNLNFSSFDQETQCIACQNLKNLGASVYFASTEYGFVSFIDELLNQNRSSKQIFVDVSMLVNLDSKTGIQRVVRSILKGMLENPPLGYDIKAVYATNDVFGYRYAASFMKEFWSDQGVDYFDLHCQRCEDAPILYSEGDIFVGLDLAPHVQIYNSNFYKEMRLTGVKVIFVLYDLLPILLEKMFSPGAAELHLKWVNTIAQNDSILCISNSVASDLKNLIGSIDQKSINHNIRIDYFHMGADIQSSKPSVGLPDNSNEILSSLETIPTFLMVGTLEPRKGYAYVLTAFENLWENGFNVNLIFVGKQGWNIDELIDRIKRHPELNKRLFWLNSISDEYLEKIYAVSTCLIAASEGEGFGLPLIEAAQHSLPIIARDLSVFKEVAKEYAYYFSGSDPMVLTNAVIDWLNLNSKGLAPQSKEMPWQTWKESTDQILSFILEDRPS